MPLFGNKRQSTGPEDTSSTSKTVGSSANRRGSALASTFSKLNCNNYRHPGTPKEKPPKAAVTSLDNTHNTTLRDTESSGPPSTVRSKGITTSEHVSEMTLGTAALTATAGDDAIKLTERSVYDWIWEYNEQFTETSQYSVPSHPQHAIWNTFWETYHTPDYILVRPSGNSLDRQGIKAMFETGHITGFCEEVMAVESIKILAPQVAVAVYKTEQIFYYQGKKEEDFATWTSVLVIHEGKPKITNIHRSTGHNINAGGRTSG